ncbi:MAG: hypothetical protein N3A62_02820 [Thermodesulfovibrionales bacterium]|nr:hypothetical protein [Thermodesulfovibrionales bacterium]
MQDDLNGSKETNDNQDQQQEKDTTQQEKKQTEDKDISPRKTVDHSRAVYKQKVEESLKSFEEILRIIHATNWRNQQLAKRSVVEIELVTKNAILSLKGL